MCLEYAPSVVDLPVRLGTMPEVPPALRYRIADVLGLVKAGTIDAVGIERLNRLLDDGEPWLGADPSLAEVGYWMIDAKHAVELRMRGCIWLTMFPSVETASRLAALVHDPATPQPVREQAIWTLGY